MYATHSHDREPEQLPIQGRCGRPVSDSRLKVKARRHERRRSRAEVREAYNWSGEGPAAGNG